MTSHHAHDCLHCRINHVMDERNEAVHMSTGKPVNIDDNVKDLMCCAAELVAMYDDARTRKFVAKKMADYFLGLVRECRATGRYPGGPGAGLIRPETEH
jgi:hypothetical protein